MKRMFYAAHTPSFLFLSLPLALWLSFSLLLRLSLSFSSSIPAVVSLVGQNTYRTYRLLPAAFPVILSGHRRPGRELLLTCMHTLSHLYSLHPLFVTRPLSVDVFIRYNEATRDSAQRDTYKLNHFVRLFSTSLVLKNNVFANDVNWLTLWESIIPK